MRIFSFLLALVIGFGASNAFAAAPNAEDKMVAVVLLMDDGDDKKHNTPRRVPQVRLTRLDVRAFPCEPIHQVAYRRAVHSGVVYTAFPVSRCVLLSSELQYLSHRVEKLWGYQMQRFF